MLSSEKKELPALPQAFGVGSHCTPSAEKGIFIAFLAHFQHLVPRWETGSNAKACFLAAGPAVTAKHITPTPKMRPLFMPNT